MNGKNRDTGIELLRIIAIVMVLICHIDFHAVGNPGMEEILSNPTGTVARVLFSSVSKCCVILFVLISGWFSVKATFRGAASFLFQCLFFTLGGYCAMRILGLIPESPMTFLRCFWFGESCWFEKSYFALFLLSPVINKYIEHTDKCHFSMVLFSFLAFQVVYGLTGSTAYINHGYSAFSFIAFYMLGRYARLYLADSAKIPGTIFLTCTLANALLYIALCRYGLEYLPMSYINPLVIVQGVALLLWINNLKMGYNRHINSIAKSTFAVYLLHTCPALWTPLFIPWSMYLHHTYSGFAYLLMVVLTFAAIFLGAFILDIPRRYIYERISNLSFIPFRNAKAANRIS